MRGGASDADGYEFVARCWLWENSRLALRGAAVVAGLSVGGWPLGRAFDEHLNHAADLLLVDLARDLLLQGDNVLEALALDGFGDVVGQLLVGVCVPSRSEYLNMKAES